MTKTLKDIIIQENLSLESNPEYGTDKGGPKSYVEHYYEQAFLPLKNKKIILVEIGVRGGASICLWKNYFSNKATIYGIDNLYEQNNLNVSVNSEWISGNNIHYVIGDAYHESTLEKLPPKIDILIDDGPHSFESHVRLLELYVPRMKKGGKIIIEDINYPPDQLFGYVPSEYKETSTVYDFGGYDNRIIEITV